MTDNSINKALSILCTDNKLTTIEEVRRSIRDSLPAVGVRYTDGVVLVSQSWETGNQLVDKSEFPYTRQLTTTTGATFAGNPADGRELIRELRESMLSDYEEFGSVSDIDYHVEQISERMQEVSLDIVTRPYGVELIVGGLDQRDNPKLYHVEPDGVISSWFATAVGSGQSEMMNYLESMHTDEMNRDRAIQVARDCLELTGSVDVENLDGCYIESDGYTELQPNQLVTEGEKQ